MNGALQALEELRADSKLSKDRHFAAAERKHHQHVRFGLPVVIINLFTGSVLASSLAKEHANPVWLSTVATLFAFVAASLSGVQTFFNFHRMAEGHRSVANRYSSIARRCKNIIQQNHDQPIAVDEIWKCIDEMRTEYDQVNRDAEGYPTSKEDFEKARHHVSVTPFEPPQSSHPQTRSIGPLQPPSSLLVDGDQPALPTHM